ncbi:spore coat protein H [Lachnotalea glycerini]|uniref:Spore coat protein H n=1 Tax=Lachnotalea glycerini TaxID=1763509 RepID=A0A318ET88_9FIRM|nr:CotH kinase family protein [Lachnotalea glycerini]PXV96185.1 spore coat protein H [Lachnotalea glycerini]
MKKIKCLILIATVAALAGCSNQMSEKTEELGANGETTVKETTVDIIQQKDINETPIVDDEAVYSYDDPSSIICFYVTVRKGATGTDTDHSFSEVNSVSKFVDNEHAYNEVKAEALVQVGDESGPLEQMLGYGLSNTNATIEIRGNSTSTAVQKSYTLKLFDHAGLWRSQRKIALVKSVADSTRMRNKLYFDLLREVPDLPSLRTQFVRLFVKDETSGAKAFEDYGLFTQVETPNKKYLKNHGLDSSGYLYKARSFNFELNDKIKNFDDPDFDLEKFETVFTCNGKEDNTRLIEMIQAVDDTTKDIDTVIDTYFDRDNYLTWLAYNILMGNVDTTMQNFYLYSPLNGNKWYFIPWDGDGSLMNYEYELKDIHYAADWEKGMSTYWSVILHKRFLSIQNNRDQLTEKIELLKNQYLTREKVTSLVDTYNNAINQYVTSMPDILYLSITPQQRADIVNKLYDNIETNYKSYYDTLEGLMPFFLGTPVINDNNVQFSWDESYDMQGELVDYTFFLSSTPDFNNIIYTEDNIRSFSAVVSGLKAGKYYWKVIASTEDGRNTCAFDKTIIDGNYYDGVGSLVVE